MELKDACIGYEPGSPLITNVNLQIRRGMKILIRGPNGAGKSTLLHSLRGEIPLIAGERSKNEQLRLGVFTQDLAQELDPNERAVDLVTQNVRDFDIGISDENARAALGGLGLTGEKALRRLRDLSGGEKARVALAMFALKPSNMYLLDEVSNHLDIECVEALSESLSGWGNDLGTVVVISHDKAFCEKIGFTHVLTVDNGAIILEQREVTEKDWDASSFTLQRASTGTAKASKKAEMDPATRKKLFNGES
jgi:ATPase subunit of ABC transporter with duplicated ATPase domains